MTDDAALGRLAGAIVDGLLELRPEWATALGDHRYDDRLSDRGPSGLAHERAAVARWQGELEDVYAGALSPADRVDAEILRAQLAAHLFALDELRETSWNPLGANPGTAIYLLLARDFAPLPDRLRSLAGRLAAVPESLAVARASLSAMPRVHVETAIEQFAGTIRLVEQQVGAALDAVPALTGEVAPARQVALAALTEHRDWLAARLPEADGEFRLGQQRYAEKLRHTLDTATSAADVLAGAEADLAQVEAELIETAAGLGGMPREVLDRLAAEHPDDATIVACAERELAATRDFVRAGQLVTLFDDPVRVIVMPEIHRGVAVAYCDPPGPLETGDTTTFFAISPTPAGWPPERVESFYREYNTHMIANLTVHEAMPGHLLQLAHARRYAGSTLVRAAFRSGSFVEGWAVYAERLMVQHGYGGAPVRMQQLKMAARMILNAVIDQRVHAHGMTEAEAMALLTGRGHQEEGEAAGKWRRACLTSTQLSTYYVGYREVSDIAVDLAVAHSSWSLRERHDAMLAHGSPPPRHLRTVLGLPPEPA